MISEVQANTLEDESASEQSVTAEVPETANAKPTVKSDSTSEGLVVYRASKAKEIVNIRNIAMEFHAESRYAHLQFSDEKMIHQYTKAITNSSGVLVIYVQYGGETVGLLQAGVGDYYLGVGGRMVTIYSLYVSAKVRGTFLGGKVGVKLLRLVTEWAKSQNAEEMHIHATSGIDPNRADKMLSRMGFKTIGGNYVARLG